MSHEGQHAGWVFKQGSLVRNWKKRFLVLRGKQLAYYDSANVTPKSKEKGSFQVITVELSSDLQNGLLVHGKGGRVLKLYTDSAESTRAWHTAILEATTGIPTGVSGSRMSMSSFDTTSSTGRRYSLLSSATGGTDNNSSSVIDVDDELELLDRLDSLPLEDANNQSVESVHHAGWLKKEGSRVKNWKRRYFTLHGTTLSYFDNADTGSAAKGYGHVKSVEVNATRVNSLDIEFERGRVLRVCAKNADDMEQWLCVLSEAIELQQLENSNLRQSLATRGSFRTSLQGPPSRPAMPMRHSIAAAPRSSSSTSMAAPSPSPSKPQHLTPTQLYTQKYQYGSSAPTAGSKDASVIAAATSALVPVPSFASSHSSYLDEYSMETDSDEYASDDSEGDWI